MRVCKHGCDIKMFCLLHMENIFYCLNVNLWIEYLDRNKSRVVTKISSCRVNTTSRRGIKWLGISFGSIFLLFSNKSSRGLLS